jgi:hypothetical protein
MPRRVILESEACLATMPDASKPWKKSGAAKSARSVPDSWERFV